MFHMEREIIGVSSLFSRVFSTHARNSRRILGRFPVTAQVQASFGGPEQMSIGAQFAALDSKCLAPIDAADKYWPPAHNSK
jgi:hypothetical protein